MYAYSKLEYEMEMIEELIKKEMLRKKKIAVKAISSIVHFEMESFSRILAYAWFDSLADAEKIADQLNLSKLDFLAIKEDFEGFKELYLENQEEAQNF